MGQLNNGYSEPLELDSRARKRVKYCPCGKSNRDGKFCPYVGYENFGYCHSCGQTFFPENGTVIDLEKLFVKKPEKPVWNYHEKEVEIFQGGYWQNNLVIWLKKYFSNDQIDAAIVKYKIGTSSYWNGSTVFFQFDQSQRCRYGKVVQFNPNTGKTVKEPRRRTIRLATTLNLKTDGYNTKQCLFGLHLRDVSSSVFLVESEKTAIVMSMKYPDAVVMATGGKGGLKYDYIKPIKDKKIMAFPDADGVGNWMEQAEKLRKYGFDIDVVDVVEQFGLSGNDDILDFWLKTGDLRGFREKEEETEVAETKPVTEPKTHMQIYKDKYPGLESIINEFGLELMSINRN